MTPSTPPAAAPPSRDEAPGPSNAAADRARDHLANERTFLAWLRTGIAVGVLGFAIGRLSLALPLPESAGPSVWLGTAVTVAGVAVCLAGLWRYRQGRRGIDTGDFRPSDRLIEVVTIGAVLFGVLFAIFLVLPELRLG